MSLAQILSTYGTLNLLLILGFMTLFLYSFLCHKANRPLSAQIELRLNYFVLSVIFFVAFTQSFMPKRNFFEPAAKVWSAETIKLFPSQYSAFDKGGYLSISTLKGSTTFEAEKISTTLDLIALFLFFTGALFIGRDLYLLLKIKRKSHLIKKIGLTSVFINDEIAVPFSYWTPSNCNVIIPHSFLSKPKDFKIALFHELQHHRQNDTKWVYIIWFFKIICILNPIVHLWSKKLSEIQEFACDEALVDQNKVESQQYARCLFEVAENAFNQKYVPACATGLTFLVERNLLKRRIVKMTTKSKRMKNSVSAFLGMFIVALMMATAFASQGLVQDRRVSMDEAIALGIKAKGDGGFPIVINDLVLKQLNRYIGTPEGRDLMRQSLQRLEIYKPLIQAKVNQYALPIELLAIPINESAYQNLPESNRQGYGAGIWMFIKSTARNYGLRVDDQIDERLNVTLETDAAMRYLKSNNLLFNDWLLAIFAYNIGEGNLAKAIKEAGTRDAWTLISKGYEGDKDYLARIMASVIIMKNPEILN